MTIGFKANNDGSVAIQVNGTDRVSMTSAGAMSVPAGVTADLTGNVAGNVTGNVTGNSSTATQLSTASGAAPSYSARAWVNFNGIGTVAIRDSKNVSSITDNGVGNYTINFTSAMANANYATVGCVKAANNNAAAGNNRVFAPYGATTAASSVIIIEANAGTAQDCEIINAAIFS